MSLRARVVDQFRRPRGALGHVAGWIMAARGSNRERNTWTVGLLDIHPRHRILEIGCGPGLALAACAAAASDGHVVGLDHSAAMLRQARSRTQTAAAAGRLELVAADLDALPPGFAPFDRIFSVNVVQFLPDRRRAFAKVLALLAPGGVAATTFQPRSRRPSRAEAQAMADEVHACMAAAGFVNLRRAWLPLEPVPAVCVLGTRPAS